MAKIITTPCPDHADCTLRITAGNGQELFEHVRTLMLSEADALNSRLDSVEATVLKFNDHVHDSTVTDDLAKGLEELRVQVASTDLPVILAEARQATALAHDVLRRFNDVEDQFRQAFGQLGEVRAAVLEKVEDVNTVAGAAAIGTSKLDGQVAGVEKALAELTSEVGARLKALEAE